MFNDKKKYTNINTNINVTIKIKYLFHVEAIPQVSMKITLIHDLSRRDGGVNQFVSESLCSFKTIIRSKLEKVPCPQPFIFISYQY